MNDVERLLNEQLDRLDEHTQRLQRAILAVRNGESFTEAFDEVFLEDSNRESKLFGKVARMIEHLLKLAYCSSDEAFHRNKNTWVAQFENPREEVHTLLARKQDRKKLLRYASDEVMQEAYDASIEFYEHAMKKYPDLEKGRKLIPPRNPWTFDQLMKLEPKELVLMLDNAKNKL